MVPIPKVALTPSSAPMRSKACTKNSSIITAIVTSGMMTGR
jgi:hypothetical protein